MRSDGSGDDVRRIGIGAAVSGGAELTFGVGLHDEAREVRNRAVEFVDLVLPPRGYSGIPRIESIYATNFLGAGKVDGEDDLYAPRTEGVGDGAI